MGQNLVLNMNDHGFKVAVFNRTYPRWTTLSQRSQGHAGRRSHSIEELTALLKRPRRVMLMVKRAIRRPDNRTVLPHLEVATYSSTAATRSYRHQPPHKDLAPKHPVHRHRRLRRRRRRAHRPSIMPGNPAAWPHVKPIFQAIAAKVEDGTPCCDWVAKTAQVTSSRWSTTASSTAICNYLRGLRPAAARPGADRR